MTPPTLWLASRSPRRAELLRTLGQAGEGAADLNAPTHLSWGPDGLYITDTFNNRIQVWGAQGQPLRTVGERGVWVGQLARPKGVLATPDGITLVVESLFGHVLVFGPQGEFLLGVDGAGLPGGGFMLPAGIWQGDDGRIYVADMFNGRVVVLRLTPDAVLDLPQPGG
jgi:DNA-binding beta-propeller fold protein YncE